MTPAQASSWTAFRVISRQAEKLDEMLADLGVKLDVVLELLVDEEEVIRRLAERARIDNRSDDNEETIRHRLVVYREQTAPLVSFYEKRGLLEKINAVGPIEEVTQRAMTALKSRA